MEIVCFTLNLGARKKNIHAKQSFGDPPTPDLGNTNEQTGGEEEEA